MRYLVSDRGKSTSPPSSKEFKSLLFLF